MEWVVLEREFEPPLTPNAVLEMAKASNCMDLYGVEPVRSYLAENGRRMVCVFRAPDAEAVRAALRGALPPGARAWASSLHTP